MKDCTRNLSLPLRQVTKTHADAPQWVSILNNVFGLGVPCVWYVSFILLSYNNSHMISQRYVAAYYHRIGMFASTG